MVQYNSAQTVVYSGISSLLFHFPTLCYTLFCTSCLGCKFIIVQFLPESPVLLQHNSFHSVGSMTFDPKPSTLIVVRSIGICQLLERHYDEGFKIKMQTHWTAPPQTTDKRINSSKINVMSQVQSPLNTESL